MNVEDDVKKYTEMCSSSKRPPPPQNLKKNKNHKALKEQSWTAEYFLSC